MNISGRVRICAQDALGHVIESRSKFRKTLGGTRIVIKPDLICSENLKLHVLILLNNVVLTGLHLQVMRWRLLTQNSI